MKIGIFGFGKTGQAVAKVLISDKRTRVMWVARTSKNEGSAVDALGLDSNEPAVFLSTQGVSASQFLDQNPVDVIVDFSSVTGIDFYGDEAAKRGISIVSAVSNYEPEAQNKLRKLSKKTRVLWSPNITLGINFLFMAAKAVKAANPVSDVQVSEEHFREKPEVSGTAKRLSKMLGLEDAKIHSVRAGGIVGIHEVLFGYQNETLRLRHESISREAFGDGALFATLNIHHRPHGFYRMEDLLLPYFGVPLTDTGSVPVISSIPTGSLLTKLVVAWRKRRDKN